MEERYEVRPLQYRAGYGIWDHDLGDWCALPSPDPMEEGLPRLLRFPDPQRAERWLARCARNGLFMYSHPGLLIRVRKVNPETGASRTVRTVAAPARQPDPMMMGYPPCGCPQHRPQETTS